jgi:hypothetical protein
MSEDCGDPRCCYDGLERGSAVVESGTSLVGIPCKYVLKSQMSNPRIAISDKPMDVGSRTRWLTRACSEHFK